MLWLLLLGLFFLWRGGRSEEVLRGWVLVIRRSRLMNTYVEDGNTNAEERRTIIISVASPGTVKRLAQLPGLYDGDTFVVKRASGE